jgi:hypothetical protein
VNEPSSHHRLSLEEFREMRRDNPRALLSHIEELKLNFVFGIEDRREDESRWGGEVRVLLNRNLTLHLVPGFNEDMLSFEELPQFCIMPNADRSDQTQETEQSLDDGEVIKGVIFYVDPFDYDAYMREAISIFEEYEDWEAVPDSYFPQTELARFISRAVLDHPTITAERKFDFRLNFVGGKEPPPIDEDGYTAEELIAAERDKQDKRDDDDGDDGDDGDDDDEPPLEGMRSLPVEWGGD